MSVLSECLLVFLPEGFPGFLSAKGDGGSELGKGKMTFHPLSPAAPRFPLKQKQSVGQISVIGPRGGGSVTQSKPRPQS